MGALRTCETGPKVKVGAGGGGESAWYGGSIPLACAPERGDYPENGSDNGNRDDGTMGTHRGALTGEDGAAGGVMD